MKIDVHKQFNMSYIDNIVKNNIQRRNEKEVYMNTLKKEVNFTNFFTEDDEKGFTSKELFLDEIHSLGRYDIQKIEDFFEKVSQKAGLYISPFPQAMNGKEMEYYSVRPISKNVIRAYMLPAITGMKKLIECYAADYYNFELSLKDLYEHANA